MGEKIIESSGSALSMRARSTNVLLLSLFLTAASSHAVSPDSHLLQLVPPGSQVVAGILPIKHRSLTNYFLLITRNNRIDLQDFHALTGVDLSRKVQEIIYVSALDRGALREHSLLVRGVFDRESIFRSADGVKARRHTYKGVPILIVQPFERERDFFRDVRWLAILGIHIAIFGTSASVQEELDRHLERSPLDPTLAERLKHLRKKDSAWCLLDSPWAGEELYRPITRLDPEFGELVRNARSLLFGIELGDRVAIDYEVVRSHAPSGETAPTPISQGPILSLLESPGSRPRAADVEEDGTVRGVLTVSRSRYEEWLTENSAVNRAKRSSAQMK